jgi:hypothetical protein
MPRAINTFNHSWLQRPQSLAVHISLTSTEERGKTEAYVGWTGMASASSLGYFNASGQNERGMETLEIDPQYARDLGFLEGDIVSVSLLDIHSSYDVCAQGRHRAVAQRPTRKFSRYRTCDSR